MAGTAASCADRQLRFGPAALVAATLALAACGDESGQDDKPFDFYVLSLSWSPSYCAAEGTRADRQQCDQDLGFVVHGLWPQFETGWPEYCDDDAPRPSRRQVDDIDDVIPSDGLIRHQWRKHGTCTGLDIDAYFDATRAALDAVALPRLSQDRLPAASIRSVFLDANPGLPEDGLAVTCSDGLLREVRLCMTTELAFRSCPEVAQRSCRQSDLRIPRM
ncbi:ribonuclease T [Aliihoeflea aestuarii]|jgi:ribonuclease T2|uniref:ribonuclease T2 n=1 Tax=Aliihoeflea aestuarii TaxID=453840 RepID=UPI002094694B|nr:ribonuclease T2 [Aliihoeflea aestuarii]MCO6392747.1 ribonuclease T [Aliihoeflea aestuarii]